MPTYLKLCQAVHEEAGIAGAIASVTDQTGSLLRVCNYVKKANRKIQIRKGNWNFLWSEWDLTMVSGTSEYPPPTAIGSFDEESFWIDKGTDDARKLKYIDYKEWRDVYSQAYSGGGDVDVITVKPNGNVAVLPAPDATGSVITADYWKSHVDLTDGDQVSLIPEEFHGTIVSLAKMYLAEYNGDTGLYAAASIEHEEEYRSLKAHSLPGNKNDLRSETSSQMTVIVE